MYLTTPLNQHPQLFFPSNPQPQRTKNMSFVKVHAKLNNVMEITSEPKSFYELLGIPETVSLFEIKEAYKQLVRKYHPDVSPPDRVEEYTQRFIRVREAYETLSDPMSRDMYDKDMSKGLHFAFSPRRRSQNDESMENKGEWKNRWNSQLSELKRRNAYKDSDTNMSWGARMRRQRNEVSL
ncbi:Chaperone protein dnaJ 20, chloroplastic [Capsicum annuum]|uniref:Chaperone protein dnaJ 20, chloroplastic n=1 Tax=Capsicum annuum TaxID=4072 RepID=A0A1U8GBT9_CAPAN|nr:chaperone protein dnaJ 20, chloroplastic [Capsicum annuum]KAF3623245.1 Chaperone protein dnaJ 20, chloroplastic [Capsicum annuum]PHT62792.1 Chaperone protein dnaJ 20, chloroplastic [Capsicum annuum]